MAYLKRSIQNPGELFALPDIFLRGDAFAGFQVDLARESRFEVLLDKDLIAPRTGAGAEAQSLLHPSRYTHVRRIMHDPLRRIAVVSFHKNATNNPIARALAPKIAALPFANGFLKGDPLKRTALTLAGRTGKGVPFAAVGTAPAAEINLPEGWAHAEFTATRDDLFAFLPGGKALCAASFDQMEKALIAGTKVRWDLAYESRFPIIWASRQVGDGIVLGTFAAEQALVGGRLMSAQGLRPVRGAHGPAKLTPVGPAIASGGPDAVALDGLTMSPDGATLRVAFRSVSEKEQETPLPVTKAFKETDAPWRGLIESMNALPR
ncbi:hypothetical protein EPO34_03810 [Patescibacteria group bacterium]|nr:MAG: hypothetical protein EPO34_03810 [Patescibacteria group bacterium]